jgi:N-carbamoyl-L-amino-acid hydrolase
MAQTESAVVSVVEAVSERRLWQRHMAIAEIGATGRGGVNRQALTPEDTQARAQLLAWTKARGYEPAVDAIGNLFIRRHGRNRDAPPVVAGSHLDTQPAGGNFDGVYGVLAALEVMEAVDDAGIPTERALELVVWTNEEGARFQPTTMGSAVFAGVLPLAAALATRDFAGITVEAALAQTLASLGVSRRKEFRSPMTAYMEAHIEQGPQLEAEGKTIGVVTGIQGLRWFQVEVLGQQAHAGTTPLRSRRDALVCALEMIEALRKSMHDETDTVRFTVGRFEVFPNSPNTVPSRALFTIDLRHPRGDTLATLGDSVEAICCAYAGPCAVKVTEALNAAPTVFDPRVVELVRAAAKRQRLPSIDMVSGATHDAKFMAQLCPSAMIFVPCLGGVSHSEAEAASPGDLAAGTRVLAEVMLKLANQ